MSVELLSLAEEALATKGSAIARVTAVLDLERNPLADCRLGRLTQDHDAPARTDPDAMAGLIMATVQGGYVLARAHQDPAAFDQAIDGVKQVLKNLAVDPGQR